MGTVHVPVSAIVAVAHGGVIGADGTLPWELPDDLRYFKKVTAGATVIMGRLNWESLPDKVRPLPGRCNIVVSRNLNYRAPGAEVCDTVRSAIQVARMVGRPIFVIGGASIYGMFSPQVEKWYVTQVHARFRGDILIPSFWGKNFRLVSEEQHPKDDRHKHAFTFNVYERV